MKKHIIIYLLLLITFSLNGQENTEVKYNYKTNDGNSCEAILHIKNSESVFRILDKRENGIDPKLSTEDDVITVENDALGIFTYSDKNENYTRLPLYKNEIMYKYNAPSNFIFENETKTINGYNCQKVTLNRNGRQYEIWFTTDVSIEKGPLNINGLPGLIIEVNELYNNVTISFIEINKTTNTKDFDFVKTHFNTKKLMSFDAYSKKITDAMCAKKAKMITTVAELGGEIAFPDKHNSFTNLLIDFPNNLVEELKKIN